MKPIHIGIVGIGNMGSFHAESLFTGKIHNACLHSVMDIDQSRLDWAKKFEGVFTHNDFDTFIQDSELDAVIVATPHYFHPTLGLEVIQHKKHLLIEKPAGVFTKNVRILNRAAEQSQKVFSIMMNQRTNPLYQKIKEMIENNELGELRRINWIVTNWYRSTTYYRSGGWRATWEKEGGGVLLNQAPHQLDLLQWLFGMPKTITAFMNFGAHRHITVENDVTVFLSYHNGATGVFVTSTFDAPGTNRLEVIGSRGKLIAEQGNLTFYRLDMDEREFDSLHHENAFAAPPFKKEVFEIKENPWGIQHQIILQNFVDAIRENKRLLAPGVEGIHGLTLSNAMHLSSFLQKTIECEHLDEELFIRELDKRIAMEKTHENT